MGFLQTFLKAYVRRCWSLGVLILLTPVFQATMAQPSPRPPEGTSPALRKCLKTNTAAEMRAITGTYKVAYHFGDESFSPERCLQLGYVSEEGLGMGSLMYSRNHQTVSRPFNFGRYSNGTITFTLEKNRKQSPPVFTGTFIMIKSKIFLKKMKTSIAFNVHLKRVRGVLIVYICPRLGTDQVILLAYRRGRPGLAKVADEVAKTFFKKPRLYKVDHRGCGSGRIIVN